MRILRFKVNAFKRVRPSFECLQGNVAMEIKEMMDKPDLYLCEAFSLHRSKLLSPFPDSLCHVWFLSSMLWRCLTSICVFDREKHHHPLHHHHAEPTDHRSAVLWHTPVWVCDALHHRTLCHQTMIMMKTMMKIMMSVFVFLGRESTVTSSPSVNTSHPTCPSPSRSRESRTHSSYV